MSFFTYKFEEGCTQDTQKREQNIADDNSEEEDYNDHDENVFVCKEDFINNCIKLMENGSSPFDILKSHYGENAPIFNILFLQKFIQFFNLSQTKDMLLTYFIINGPVENATRLLKYNFLNILFTDLPANFIIIHHLLSKTTSQGKNKFIETGGIYVLCNFVSNPQYTLIISQIFYILSDIEFDYFNDILPPNAFYPINCNFETTSIFTFKDLIKQLFLAEDLQILSLLIQSFKNIFHRSEKAIQKLGNLLFKQLFIKRQLFLNRETQFLIPDLIELFNILCDHFDNFDLFRIDMINYFYTLMVTYDFQHKISLSSSFLSLINDIPTHMLPSILAANTLQILEDLIFLDNSFSFISNIIETVSDIATKIIMYNDEYSCSLDKYLSQCKGIIGFLCDNDDPKISELAESTNLAIDKIAFNVNTNN
ncbi:hypothetical protein M9Y10_000868 [Tritrichomonas musculus]|uniref:FPL domain-containing protein n=1 Tax=Tritrichomonas musculus TaxID=1915356 RepID=A0ABR2L6D5_9EUKA